MLFQVALKNLRRNPRRTIVSMLTVGSGTCALLLFHGFNQGIMNQYRDNTVHARFGHGQINVQGYREQVFEKPWEHWLENYDDLALSLQSYPEITHLFPRVDFSALLTNGQITVSGRGQGMLGPAESEFFNTMNIVAGTALNEEPDGILLGMGLARSLGVQPGDRITVLGQTIYGSINGLDLLVTGVFHTGLKEVDDALFKVQLSRAHALLDTNLVESVALGLKDYESWDSFAARFAKDFPALETTPFAVLDKVYYQHAVDWLGQQFHVIQVIILIIVTLGIGNTISFTILERKREIGNLRANGESSWEVLRLLVFEGIYLGLLGASLGAGLAWLLDVTLLQQGILMPPAPGITRQYHVKLNLDLQMTFIAIVLGFATSVVATFFAGQKVVRIPIGEALRSH